MNDDQRGFLVRCTECDYETLRWYYDKKCSKCGGLVDVLLQEDKREDK